MSVSERMPGRVESKSTNSEGPGPTSSATLRLLVVAVAMAAGLGVAVLMTGGLVADSRVVILLAAGPIGVVLGVVAVTRFEWFVLVILVVRPSLDILGSGGLGPGAMLAAVFVSTGALWLVVQYRSGDWVPMSSATRALAAFALVVVLSVLTSLLRTVSAVGALEILAGIMMFLVLEQLLGDRPDRARRIVIAVLVSGIVPLAVGFVQWMGGDVVSGYTDLSRIQGTFAHPNPFATYLVMLILLSTALVMAVDGLKRFALLGYLGILGFMLVVTYNRASWIALIVGLAYVGARRRRGVLLLMVVVLVGVAFTVPSVGERISDLTAEKELPEGVPNNSLEWRIQYWEQLIPLANESPLTGIGPQVVLNTRPEGLEPHNVYVQAYVETGALGLLALGSVIVAVSVTLSERRKHALEPLDRALSVAAIGIAIAIFVKSPSENLLNQTMSWWYFAAAGTWGFRRFQSTAEADVVMSEEQSESLDG